MNPLELIRGRDFDTTASNIQIRADRIGASVFEVPGFGKIIRVLAHNEASAKRAAKSYAEEQRSGQ